MFSEVGTQGNIDRKDNISIARMFSEVGTQGNIDRKDNVSTTMFSTHRGTLKGNIKFLQQFFLIYSLLRSS